MKTSPENALIGPLYHGTRVASAKSILRDGFRRSRSRSYTGTGVCLTEAISIAYEYGSYETRGCILEVWLSASATWCDSEGFSSLERSVSRDAYDDFFKTAQFDAVRTYGGNVWVLWNASVTAQVRALTHREALRLLCVSFEQDGPDHGYNGVVSDYASLWWGNADNDPNLARFSEHRQRLERTLKRHVGSIRAPQLILQPE